MQKLSQVIRQHRLSLPLRCCCHHRCLSGRTALYKPGELICSVLSDDIRLHSRQRQYSSIAASQQTAGPSSCSPLPSLPQRATLSSFFRKSFLAEQIDGLVSYDYAAGGQADILRHASSTEDPLVSSTPASSRLADAPALRTNPPMMSPTSAWRSSAYSATIGRQLYIYKQLAKGRLSAWIVLTAMAGYAMCPTDPTAAALAMDALVNDTFGSSPLVASGFTVSSLNSFRVTTLLATATGTALCSASANTFNQLIEIPYDAQMARTAKRPLPSHLITPLHAFTFGSVSGAAGTTLLYACVNPLVSSLGLLNIVLYAGVYTPLKRLSVVNTWVGAVVGGIPPLMGWAACTNSLNPFSGQAGAWILAMILFAWQFPHFNALSWTIRSEYARGGYRMLSAVDPGMNARVSLRWTVVGALAAGIAAPLVGLTSWAIGIATLIPSGALALAAWRFWRAGSRASLAAARQNGVAKLVEGSRATDRDPRDAPARSLFFISLVHLPALLFLMMASKITSDWHGSEILPSAE